MYYSYKKGMFFLYGIPAHGSRSLLRPLYLRSVQLVYCEGFTIICGLPKNNLVKIPRGTATVAGLNWLMRLQSDFATQTRAHDVNNERKCATISNHIEWSRNFTANWVLKTIEFICPISSRFSERKKNSLLNINPSTC